MQGGMPWDSAWALSHQEREMIISSLNEKIRRQSGDTTEYM